MRRLTRILDFSPIIALALCWVLFLANSWFGPYSQQRPDPVDRIAIVLGSIYFWLIAINGMRTGRLWFFPEGPIDYHKKPLGFWIRLIITLTFACGFMAVAFGWI